jgi:hypothetical protein
MKPEWAKYMVQISVDKARMQNFHCRAETIYYARQDRAEAKYMTSALYSLRALSGGG